MLSEGAKLTKTDIESILQQSIDEKKQDLQNRLDTQAEKVQLIKKELAEKENQKSEAAKIAAEKAEMDEQAKQKE